MARRKEGPRAPLFFPATCLAALFAAAPAIPQSVDVSALELCAGLETEALKLRCFEAIIAGSKTDAEAPVEAPPEPVAARPAATPAIDAASEAAPVPAARPSPAPVPAGSVSAVPAEPAAAALEAPAAAVPARAVAVPGTAARQDATDASREDQFGSEHLAGPEAARERQDEVLYATVVEVTEGRRDILYFHLDNGQVWRQNEARYYPYPKDGEFDVSITRGMMGEYKMRIGDNGRMVRIRRIE